MTDVTALADLLSTVHARFAPGETRRFVETIWNEAGDARARPALHGALERKLPRSVRVQLLRDVHSIDPEFVATLARDGDVCAAHVAREAAYLAGGDPAVPLDLASTYLPLACDVVERVLCNATSQHTSALKRLIERMGIDDLDYRDATRLARRAAALPPEVREALGMPKLKVALLGTVTTDYLQPILAASLLEHGVVGTVRSGAFGQLEETVLDDASWLSDFRPDLVIVLDSSLALETTGDEWQGIVERRASLCRSIAARWGADTVLTTLEPLCEHAAPTGAPPWLGRYNDALRAALPERAYLFDLSALVGELGTEAWFDLRLWALARQSVALSSVPKLADRIAAFVRALVDPPVKLIVTDLDDTLWGGIVAEVGTEGIELGGSGTGVACVRLQQLLRECARAGVLLAAVSKNVGDVARLPFAQRPEMILGIEDFVEFEISLVPKSIMVAQIAERLQLGLRHVLFLDNEPHERAEMRERCPDVIVPEWPEDSIFGLPALLTRRGLTVRPRVTADDYGRLQRYREEATRRHELATYDDLDAFLSSLDLTARFEVIGALILDRVTQLVQKTNQFNLTTRRHTRRELEELVAVPDSYAYAVSVADRYGPYGLTGVMVAVPEGASLTIDLWLLSCRVMGKTIEHAMFEHVRCHARAHGFETITGIFRPTERNGAVAGLFRELGFRQIESKGAEVRYEFHVDSDPATPNLHVAVTEAVPEGLRP